MPDDDLRRGSPDDGFINVNDGDELRHWARVLAIPPDTLMEAVAKIGGYASKVKEYLAAHGHISHAMEVPERLGGKPGKSN